MKKPSSGHEVRETGLNEIYDVHSFTRIYRLFILLALVGMVSGFFILLATDKFLPAVVLAIGVLPVLGSLYLVHSKRFESATSYLVVFLILMNTILATMGLGIHNINNIAYPAILIIASLVIRKRTMIFLTLLTVICMAWLVFGELSGLYKPSVLVHSIPGDFFSASVIVVLTGIMTYRLTGSLFNSFSRLQMEVTERKNVEENLRQREAILEAVTFAAEQFLKSPEWHTNINDVLERLGRIINATHAYLFEDHMNPQGELVTSMRYEWTAPGYPSDLDGPYFQNSLIHREGFEEQVEKLQRGEVRLGSTSTFTPIEKNDMDELGVKSILEVPISVNGRQWGAIGFDDMEKEREWSTAEVDVLKIAANILSAAIQRQDIEAAVRESEQIYRKAIEAADAVPYYLDYRGDQYAFVGSGIEKITGYKRDEVKPNIWHEIMMEGIPLGEAQGLSIEEAEERSRAGEISIWKADMHIRTKTGEERWLSDSAIELFDKDKLSYASIGILQDITDRKRIEADLRQREAILEAVTFAAEQFLKSSDWRLNIDEVLERLGRTFHATHTYLFEHSTGIGDVELSLLKYEWTRTGYGSDFDNPRYQVPNPINMNEESTDHDLRHGHIFVGNSSTFPPAEKERLNGLGVKAMLEVPLFVDGKWWGTFGMDDYENEREWSSAEIDALNISAGLLSAVIQRQAAESAVRESERIYRQAIEAAGAVPYYQDYKVNKYVFMGQGIQKITGYSPEEMDPVLWESIIQDFEFFGELKGTGLDDAVKLARTGKLDFWKCDYKILSHDGKLKWVADAAIELFDETGNSYGSIGILQDITDRKLIEARLRQRETMLEATTFAAEQFLKSPDWRTTIDSVLERLGMELNVSHAYLFERHKDPNGEILSSMINEWTAPGFKSDLEDDSFQNIVPSEVGFEHYYETLDSGVPLVGSTSVFTENEREYWNSLGIKAILELRIVVNGQQWGVIGFDDMEKEREWTPSEVDVIKVAANVLGAAIERQLDDDVLKNELTERRRAEQALRLSEEKFSKAFHTTQVLMTIEDDRHIFIDVNKAFEDAIGRGRDEIIGHNASELNIFYTPEDAVLLRDVLRMNDGNLRNYETPFRRKNGELGFVLLSSEKIKLDNVEYTLTSGLDITERKLAEKQIQQQAARAAALASLSQTLTRTSQDYHLMMETVVRRCAELIGDGASIFSYSPENEFLELVAVYNQDSNAMDIFKDEIGKHPIKWNEAEYVKAIGDNQPVLIPFIPVEKLIETAPLERREYYKKLPLHSLMLAPLHVQGRTLGVIGMARHSAGRNYTPEDLTFLQDIADRSALAILNSQYYTDLERELAERKRAEEKYRSIFDNSIDGIFQSTDEGRFINVNAAMARIYGYDSPEDMLENVKDIATQLYVDAGQRKDVQERLASSGKIIGYETLDYHKDGSTFWASMSVQAIRDENGNLMYYEGAVEDITLRKRAEAEREELIQELANKNAELEQFTYTVSHDLKSPLVTINGFLGYLEQDAASGNTERLKKDTQRIHEAVQKMQRLLSELLELSRIGRMMNPPTSIPFETLVKDALDIVQGQLGERNVTVHVQPGLPVVYVDCPRLIEVVQNLVDNAAKYMGDQPNPQIEIGQRGNENGLPVFFIKDNGIGIAPQYHERVFGLFNKLDAKSEGTGVGLALVRRIIEVHGGRIWVESVAGKGATFLFTLPTGPDA